MKRLGSATIIRNGRVIDPANKRDETADLYIADGKVVGSKSEIKNAKSEIEEIDAKGVIVAPGLIDMHVHIDQTRRNDHALGVNLFNFGFRIFDFGFRADDFSVGDVKIGSLIPFVCGIDHAAVANDGCTSQTLHVAIPPHK